MEKFSKTLPLVSIIMPCYNDAEYVQDAINSVLSQTYNNYELIVINDGSSDNSINILSKYKNQIILINQKNQGASRARNSGLKRAKGEYIAFLDADDYWEKDFLNLMVAKAEKDNVKLVYCGWQHVGNYKNKEPFIPPDYEGMPNKVELMIQSTRWPIHGVIIHKQVLAYTGLFNENLTSCMDFYLWIRAATAFKIARVNKVLAYYRHHSGIQITNSTSKIITNHWYVQKDFLKHNPKIISILGKKKIRDITIGEMLHRGYVAYWNRDLVTARIIFKKVMFQGYGTLKDWKYMLPSFLPLKLHNWLLKYFG